MVRIIRAVLRLEAEAGVPAVVRAAFAALAGSVAEHGGRSVKAYRESGAADADALMRTIIDTATDGVILVDRQGWPIPAYGLEVWAAAFGQPCAEWRSNGRVAAMRWPVQRQLEVQP